MKHLKSINEFSPGYHRTVGFRYSKPEVRFSITSYYVGETSIEDVTKALNSIHELTFESVEVTPESGDIEVDMQSEAGEPSTESIKVDGKIHFDILVYNEKEIDQILADFTKTMHIKHQVKIVDVDIKEHE
jgi:hypothetical protein